MCAKIMPLIVASEEALMLAAEEGIKLIYVEGDLYHQKEQAISLFLAGQGYRKMKESGKKGHFFVRSGFLLNRQDIYDPLDIL